jgi:Mn2+/Fe2+ NRAMP family transporter
MVFANLITYFIMLSTAATLFKAGKNDISTAAQAAQALVPVAGKLAGLLFTIGVVSVGFIAVPIMITGAAYDLCQALGWKHGLHYPPSEVKTFNLTIAAGTAVAMCLNFLGFNPMKALVWTAFERTLSHTQILTIALRLLPKPARNIFRPYISEPPCQSHIQFKWTIPTIRMSVGRCALRHLPIAESSCGSAA